MQYYSTAHLLEENHRQIFEWTAILVEWYQHLEMAAENTTLR